MPDDRAPRSPSPRRSERSSCAAASCTPSVPGPASAASASSTVIGAAASAASVSSIASRRRRARARGRCALAAAARERQRHHHQRDERRGRDPERDRRLAAGDPQRHGDREADPRDRLHQHEAAEQARSTRARPASPARSSSRRRPACRRSARRTARCSRRRRCSPARRAARARPPGRSARSSPGSRSARRSGCCVVPARAAFGDRAREQLFDRPVDHRDDHEHHRPQHVDPLGRFFAEHVARDREVRERQQARRGDPDRQDPRAAAVGARVRSSAARRLRGSRASCADGLEADKQHRPGERRADLDDVAVAREQRRRTSAATSGSGARGCCRAPTSRRRAPCSAPATAARGEPRRAGGARRSAPSRRACARGRGRARAPRSRSPGRTRSSANGRFSACITRYSRFGAWRSAQPAWIDSSSRSIPTTRRCSPRRCAHGARARPRHSRRRAASWGRPARSSSSSVRSKAAHQAPHHRVGASRTCRRCCR